MKKITLVELLNKNSYNTLFNAIHRNFLRHDFSEKLIQKISVYLKSEYELIKSLDCKSTDNSKKLLVRRNYDGFFEIVVFDSETKETDRKINFESLCCYSIINQNKLSKKNLLSFIFWEFYKQTIREEIK